MNQAETARVGLIGIFIDLKVCKSEIHEMFSISRIFKVIQTRVYQRFRLNPGKRS